MDVSVPQIINAYAVHPDTRRVHCIKLTWRTDHEPRPGDWKADEPMMTDDGYILDAVAERPSTAVEMAFDRLIEQLLSELSAIAGEDWVDDSRFSFQENFTSDQRGIIWLDVNGDIRVARNHHPRHMRDYILSDLIGSTAQSPMVLKRFTHGYGTLWVSHGVCSFCGQYYPKEGWWDTLEKWQAYYTDLDIGPYKGLYHPVRDIQCRILENEDTLRNRVRTNLGLAPEQAVTEEDIAAQLRNDADRTLGYK